MTHFPHGDTFSIAYIDANPLPVVHPNLLPWLLKDRREAETGGTFYNSQSKQHEHDRQGLDHAEREARRINADLDEESRRRAPGDRETDRTAILRHQLTGQEEQVGFWRGKCHLLDKVIAATRATVKSA